VGTVFPMPCALGSAWNASLVQAIGSAMAYEARAYGVNEHWSPVVNLWTDDRFGRQQEGFSPDPLVAAHLGSAMVMGLQGGDTAGPDSYLPDYERSVTAVAKHFAGYGGAAGGLNGAPLTVNNRTLFEIYLKPWRALVASGLRAAMPSHNTILDVPAHLDEWALQRVLRGEFGGGNLTTVSDCA
jgi:beta-glucosidase